MARLGLFLTIALTVVTLVFAGLMGQPGPLQAEADLNGFQRPLFALYFATSIADLAFIAGPENAALREHLMHLQALDKWFPLAYGGMAMAFFFALGVRGAKLAWLGLALAAATIGADWAENEVANRILADLDAGEDPTARLDAMWGHTWIKWGAIAGYAAVLAAIMALARRRLLAIFPALAAFGIGASYVAQADPAVFNWANQLLVPFMLTFPVAAVMYLRAKDESAEGDDESVGEGEA